MKSIYLLSAAIFVCFSSASAAPDESSNAAKPIAEPGQQTIHEPAPATTVLLSQEALAAAQGIGASAQRRAATPVIEADPRLELRQLEGGVAGDTGGACCMPFNGCFEVDSESECDALGGVYLPGESCIEGQCQPAACCTDDICATAGAYDCITAGRDYAGAGTTCAENPCGIEVGACCLGDACEFVSPEECAKLRGTFLGPGISCGTNPCVHGACCLFEDCQDTIKWQCDQMGGELMAGGSCKDLVCTVPPICPDGSIFGQAPGGPLDFDAGTSEASSPFTRFDNFNNVAGTIEAVTWWGFDLQFNPSTGLFFECIEPDNTFEITFYTNAGGFPGDVVCSYTLEATREATGAIFVSGAGIDAELNKYSIKLPEPCVVVNGWISIVGLGDPDCWFLWHSSTIGGAFCEGCSDQFPSYNHAFCLQGTLGGVTGSCCDDATGECENGVDILDCDSINQRFTPSGSCAALEPPCGVVLGACCGTALECSQQTQKDCLASGGQYLGDGVPCSQCPCILECPEGSIPEDEQNCFDGYIDIFNGGCTSAAQNFSPISIGDTVCGTSGLFEIVSEITPDLDWYEVHVDTATTLTWQLLAEFPVQFFILDASQGCPGQVLEDVAIISCAEFSISADVEPGTYWLVVGPALFTDKSLCGATYIATLTSGNIDIVGNLDGDGVVGPADLAQLLGSWGDCPKRGECPADLNGDGIVGPADLALLLGSWG